MNKYVLTAGGEILESSMLEYDNFIGHYGYWFYDEIKNKKIFEVVIIKAQSDNKEELLKEVLKDE